MSCTEEAGHEVLLYVYDLTNGLARSISPMLLGKQIQGVWHTAIVIEGVEHFYGYGIQKAPAGSTPFGRPLEVLKLGRTEVPKELRDDLLHDLSDRFTPQAYSLLFHNCNHFSNEFSTMLTGNGIPEYILTQAHEVLNTPMGEMLMPMLTQMEMGLGRATASGMHSGAANPPA